MVRNIKYKPVSKELEEMVRPSENHSTRASVGLSKAVGEYYFIDTEKLCPFKNQARIKFNQGEIDELANSIKEYGIRQPLTVIKNVDGKYEVISGERRLRAAKLIGLSKVPCIIMKEHKDIDAIALIENIHRKDLHPIELGLAYRQLIEKNVFPSQEKLAKSISVSKSLVSECIKLSNLPQNTRDQVINKGILSREKLRSLVKAHEKNDTTKVNSILGVKNASKNFSVIRISSSEGRINIQDAGLSKLSSAQKQIVKDKLENLINRLVSEIV